MRPELRCGVVCDFRNPPQSGVDNPTFHARLLDQAVWLEGLGLDLVWFTELTAYIREYGFTDLVTWAVPPGLTPDAVEASLHACATEVVPRLREAAGS